MKAPNLEYFRPRSLQEALCVLASEDEAMPLAGGQSLVAALNLRLSAPRLLVDIGDLPELAGCDDGAAELRLGSLTRHADLLESDRVREALPLLPRAAAMIGHAAIRNRGTLGGSLAFADPAAELPACVVALDATVVVAGVDGQREVKADDFFTGIMETALRPGELIVAVRFPPTATDTRCAIAEFSRRHGDFAVAGAVVAAQVDDARVVGARVVYFGCVDRPRVAATVSAALNGCAFDDAGIGRVVEAVDSDLAPGDSPGWRGDTKLRLARTLTGRIVQEIGGETQ